QWEPLTDALGTTAVGTLAMDPSNPDILFLGFGDPFDVQQPGITRSTDGGGTWATPSILKATYAGTQLTAGTVTDIKVDPRNSLIVMATSDAGLFRSIDGGDTWLATGQAADPTVPPVPNNAGTLGLWRSTDDGATWTYIAGVLPISDP